jgi:hypothetical protein
MSERALVLVALNTDQPDIKRRLDLILAAARPLDAVGEANVWAKGVDELLASDLHLLAAIIGWEAVRRLGISECCRGAE